MNVNQLDQYELIEKVNLLWLIIVNCIRKIAYSLSSCRDCVSMGSDNTRACPLESHHSTNTARGGGSDIAYAAKTNTEIVLTGCFVVPKYLTYYKLDLCRIFCYSRFELFITKRSIYHGFS